MAGSRRCSGAAGQPSPSAASIGIASTWRRRAAQARSGGTLAIHLSTANIARVVRELSPVLGADCPAAVLYRVSWPDERILRGTLGTIRAKVKAARITRTALILVGRALAAADFGESRLYAPDHHHVLRPQRKRSDLPVPG